MLEAPTVPTVVVHVNEDILQELLATNSLLVTTLYVQIFEVLTAVFMKIQVF